MNATRFAIPLIVLSLLGTTPGWTQPPPQPGGPLEVSPPGFCSIPLSFAPPRARALGMGCAFIAIAEDATGAGSSPAGLTTLTRPEVALYARGSSFDVDAVDLNAMGALDVIDFFGTPAVGDSSPVVTLDDSVTDVSFASFVKPFRRWAFSIYYHSCPRQHFDPALAKNYFSRPLRTFIRCAAIAPNAVRNGQRSGC